MTAQVGRIATTRMAGTARPLRLAYGGAVLKVRGTQLRPEREMLQTGIELIGSDTVAAVAEVLRVALDALERSEEHTSELQSLMRISYAVFCLKKKKHNNNVTTNK